MVTILAISIAEKHRATVKTPASHSDAFSYFLSGRMRRAANMYQRIHKGITHATFTLFRSFDVSILSACVFYTFHWLGLVHCARYGRSAGSQFFLSLHRPWSHNGIGNTDGNGNSIDNDRRRR